MNKLVPIGVLVLAVVYFYGFKDSFDPESIRGKWVAVTGASSGIGEHLAYEYSKLGAKVFITARRANLLEKVAKKCKELGAPEAVFLAADMGEQRDRDRVIAEVKRRFGRLDHLILNHAIVTPGLWLGTKENLTKLMDDFNVNFLSYVDLASQALPMLTQSKGSIAVVSSVGGKMGVAGQASYSTDKHAMQGFFAALRQELLLRNTGISVTTCVIAAVDTDMLNPTKERMREEKKDAFFSVLDVVETAEDTAVAIIKGVANRKYEIYFGKLAWVMTVLHNVFPEAMEEAMGRQMMSLHKLLD